MNQNAEASDPSDLPAAIDANTALETLIKNHPFFEGMSPHQHRLLADCAMPCRFTTGELILREGDPAAGFHLILRGRVTLECHLTGHGHFRIQTLVPGEALGWSWLFPPYFRNFSARALDPTATLVFHGTSLRSECEADHEFGYELLKRMGEVIAKRLEATRRHLTDHVGPAFPHPPGKPTVGSAP